jgi:ArsR family transcriptional regulator
MNPSDFFTILSDPTRLRILTLIQHENEVCVCELTFALGESQPKISRHLAIMREAGIVDSRREGTWMHYRIARELPIWATELVEATHKQIQGLRPYIEDLGQLHDMTNRPDRTCD